MDKSSLDNLETDTRHIGSQLDHYPVRDASLGEGYDREHQVIAETDDGPEGNPLDSQENLRVLRQLQEWWTQARIVQSQNRYEQAIDEDFYDGLQWSEEDKRDLEDRGQAALVFNEVKRSIDWITGTERKARAEWRVIPRTDEDNEGAQLKTKVLKYVQDVNKTRFSRSDAFKDAVIAGVGWLEDGIRSDPFDEPLYSRHESWRNMWYDHLSAQNDLSDARYVFRTRWVDADLAVAFFPERADKIRAASVFHDYYGGTDDDEFYLSSLYYITDRQGRALSRRTYIENAEGAVEMRRRRVRLIEAWYRKPARDKFVKTKDPNLWRWDGSIYDESDELSKRLVDGGLASVHDAVRKNMWLAVFIEGQAEGCLLQNRPSPYIHNDFPFTPVWGYRRRRDNAPYGVVRNQRDPQEDLNKRRSKALHILATSQVIAEEGAVADKEEARREAAAPDGYIEVRASKRFEIVRDTQLAAQHVNMELTDREYIRDAAGVTGDNLGMETNASSGRAIIARQQEGTTTTMELFDNLRLGMQLSGEKQLSLVEQDYTDEKQIRIAHDRGKPEYITLNKMAVADSGEQIVENDIAATQADFIMSEQDYRASVRQAMAEAMFDMLAQVAQVAPEAALALLDLAVELWDIPNKEEWVKRIRSINGQLDPDDQDTPEGQQAQAQRDAEKAEQAAIAKAIAKAEAAKAEADARKTQAETVATRIENIKATAEVSPELMAVPGLMPILDELLAYAEEQASAPVSISTDQQQQQLPPPAV